MRASKVQFVIIFIFSLLAITCKTTPVYEYQYTAPESADGKACTHQCETIRIQCKMIADMKAQQEKLEAKQDYLECEQKAATSEWPTFCLDTSSWIQADYSECDEAYRMCFERCGGVVEHICVENCPEE